MQTRLGSFNEAWINTAVGFGLSVLPGIVVFPLFGVPVTVAQNFAITSVYTVVSVARNYCIRRLFNRGARP